MDVEKDRIARTWGWAGNSAHVKLVAAHFMPSGVALACPETWLRVRSSQEPLQGRFFLAAHRYISPLKGSTRARPMLLHLPFPSTVQKPRPSRGSYDLAPMSCAAGESAIANFLHAETVKCACRSRSLWRRCPLLTWMAVMSRFPAFASVLLGAAIAMSAPASDARAQTIYKCTNGEGGVAFQAIPCNSGMREQQIEIEPAPAHSASPAYANTPTPRQVRPRAPVSKPRAVSDHSFECRGRNGALFYRHDRCPASIDRSGLIGGRGGAAREAVSARRIPRLEACRAMRSVGREGREFDDVPSTYERNLGRDPCRKY